MSAAKHTPGPLTVSVEDSWPFKIITKNTAGEVVFTSDMPCNSTRHKNAAEAIAGKDMDPSWNAAEHNARAIADEVLRAAAPCLLKALQGMLMGDYHDCPAVRARRAAARAAIAKATGGEL